MDEATQAILVALAAAVITAVVQWVQKKQGFAQGDKILDGFQSTLDVFDTLATKYPAIEKDVQYLHVMFDNMKAAWNDSRVKDTELQASINAFLKLAADIKAQVALIAK